MDSARKKLGRVQRLACLGIMEAIIYLPPLELVVQSEARSAVHRLCSLRGWSYLHPNQGYSSIMMQLQQSDPLLNMGVKVMRPAFNFEPIYRVTMLTREDWTKGTGTPLVVKGSSGLQMGPRWRGPGLESMGNLWEEGSVSL